METTKQQFNISLIFSFIWLGFICAISFMEAWLKFEADGVTLPIGLSIGKVVFTWLNRVEWMFALIIFFNFFISNHNLNYSKALFIIVLVSLTLQSVWIFPLLEKRADLIISGQEVQRSFYHLFYIIIEFIKAISLLLLGIKILKLHNHGN
ncbi:MAG: hypothetical protein J5I47_05870 [Vicingus serpentipes]|nr:hypothetical protein [Vicingus serpentipes]